MFANKIVEEAKEKSIELLYKLSTDKGFVASSVDRDNYKRVWGRDGVICGLASLLTKDDKLIKTFKQTLLTLKNNQDKTGRIPSNVSLDEKSVSYGTTVGRIDATIWYVIGACKYILDSGDKKALGSFRKSIEKAVFYLECLELNGRGLIYVPAGGDWADEYVNEGYVLFDQVLYALALNYYYQVTKDKEIKEKYKKLLKLIDVNYFPEKGLESELIYHKAIYKKACNKYEPPFPITSFSPFDVFYIHDLFAVSLIFNLDILTKKEVVTIEKSVDEEKRKGFPILPAFSPVIDRAHPRWKDLSHNFLYRFKNNPNEFHNGGLWPLVHGFYLASKQKLKKKEVVEFAEILKQDDYRFPEFYHGETFKPMGTGDLGFSASGFLMAYYKYKNKRKIF